eukprot:1187985-Prorocentrum_minimum.AAC.1
MCVLFCVCFVAPSRFAVAVSLSMSRYPLGLASQFPLSNHREPKTVTWKGSSRTSTSRSVAASARFTSPKGRPLGGTKVPPTILPKRPSVPMAASAEVRKPYWLPGIHSHGQ